MEAYHQRTFHSSKIDFAVCHLRKVEREGAKNRTLRNASADISPVRESTINGNSLLSIIKEITQPVENIAFYSKILKLFQKMFMRNRIEGLAKSKKTTSVNLPESIAEAHE